MTGQIGRSMPIPDFVAHSSRIQNYPIAPQNRQPNMFPITSSLPQCQPIDYDFFRRSLVIREELPLKMLVQSEMVGAIIGKSGGTIKQITQSTKARIDVHRDDCSDRNEKVISISGPIKNCSEACFKIVDIIQIEKSALNMNGTVQNVNNHSRSSDPEADPSDSDLQLKILAPNNLIGRLIGRGGSSIKKIMEQTSTKIKISTKNAATVKNEHTIVIIGNLESIRYAESVISSKLRAAHSADVTATLQATQPYLLNNNIARNPYIANAYTNPVMSSLMNPTLGSDNHTSRSMGSQTTNGTAQMYPHPHGYLPMYLSFGLNPQTSPFHYNPTINGQEYEKETVDIFIPSSMVGAIIGVSGSTIKNMINYSGASIKIAPPPNNPNAHEQKNVATSSSNSNDHNSNPCELLTSDDNTSHEVDASNQEAKSISHSKYQYFKDPGVMRRVTVVGHPESQYTAQYLIYRKVSIELGRSDTSLMVELRIPSQLVGRMIGKGGVSIKEIQSKTRTVIRFPDGQSASSRQNIETAVTITGEFQGSQLAQMQLRNMVKGSTSANTNLSRSQVSTETAYNANKTSVQTNNDSADEARQKDVTSSKQATSDTSQVNSREDDDSRESEDLPRSAVSDLNVTSEDNPQTKTSPENSDAQNVVANNNNLEEDLNVKVTIKLDDRSEKERHDSCLNGTE